MRFEVTKYERLVENILGGEVVFFVGAGFSLDSEGNTAQRLIARLLARFAALVEHVTPGHEGLAGLPLGLKRNFNTLEEAEVARAAAWTDGQSSRWEFGRVAGWSDRFHAALLREFALAEAVQRNQGPGLRLEDLRAARCYYAISDQPGWAAWGVVLEIALRRMIHASRPGARAWHTDHAYLEPAICEYPAVLISLSDELPSPTCVLLRFAGFERPGYRPEIRGVYKRLVVWELTAGVEPRIRRGTSAIRSGGGRPARVTRERQQDRSPAASDVWRWATAPLDHQWSAADVRNAGRWLGNA